MRNPRKERPKPTKNLPGRIIGRLLLYKPKEDFVHFNEEPAYHY